jgi:hypothetical protein
MKALNDAEESEIFVAIFSTELPKIFLREDMTSRYCEAQI